VRLGVTAALVDGVLVRGDVAIEDGRITATGLPPGSAGIAVPGYVDLQVNGFAGVDLLAATAEDYRRAGEALLPTGVTAYQPTFISAPVDATRAALRVLGALSPMADRPRVLPAHLEGPFLSPARRGAHSDAHLRRPSVALAGELLAAGPVGLVTLAPELEGALPLIDHLVARGVRVSIGHTDADAASAREAFEHGASAVTHVFNAMRPFTARDPGPGVAALVTETVMVMAIVDGVHLAPETVHLLLLATAPGRLALVTDAIAAAGIGDGEYVLGNQAVQVRDGMARRADGTLAGSLLTMDQAVRNLVAHGARLETALDAATRVPARLLGRTDVGHLVVGAVADVLVLDAELGVQRTYIGGDEVWAG
jgi:N-acetylglucosamine-6-phosphate deacetylase